MITLLKKETVQELVNFKAQPCLSLYMPTHKSHPDNLKDIIHFKNLNKQLEDTLLKQYSKSETEKFVQPFHELGMNDEFWNHTTIGLAVFSAKGIFRTIGLQAPVDELVVVADSFHTKPLRRYLQSTDRYQVLSLTLDSFQLFEGNRFSLEEIGLPEDMPRTLKEVLGKDLTEKHLTVASYGGVGLGSGDMHHGHGGKKDEIDDDIEKFFRFVAKEITENYSKPSGLPLILAALKEHQSLFHRVSKNPYLLPNGITKNPESLSQDEMRELAWEAMEPVYLQKLKTASDDYKQAKANNKGTDDLSEAAEALATGRVGTLLIEAKRIIAGRFVNAETGSIENGNLENPETDDLLDDIAALAENKGAEVIIMPGKSMPTETGLAAIYRY